MSTLKTLGAANIVDVYAPSPESFMTRVDKARGQFFLAIESVEEADYYRSWAMGHLTLGMIPVEGIAFHNDVAVIPAIDCVEYADPIRRVRPFSFSVSEARIRLFLCAGWCGMCPQHHIVHNDKKHRWKAERYACAVGDSEIAERLSSGFGPVSAIDRDDVACVLVRAGELFTRPVTSIPALATVVPDRVRAARKKASEATEKALSEFERAYEEQMKPFGIKLLPCAIHIDGFSLDGSPYGHWSTNEEKAVPPEYIRQLWSKRGWYKLARASREVERSRKYLDSLSTV